MSRRRLLMLLCLLAAIAATYLLLARRGHRVLGPDIPPTFAFDGKSSDLKRTQVVAALDAPIQKGKNVIWCASFRAAWKELQNGLAGGPVELEGNPAIADTLNRAYTPGRELPARSLYTAVGWEDKGILEQIRRDVAQQFPGSEPPIFPGLIPGSFVAYSHLEARVRFDLPYFQSTKPLEFIGGDGKKAGVSSFGIREEDDYAYKELRKQPRVLRNNWGEAILSGRLHPSQPPPPPEFIVDLDSTSQPTQIIVAMVGPKATLAEALAAVEQKTSSYARSLHAGFGDNDVLLVPDLAYRVSHHFAEFEGRRLLNPALRQGQQMDVAQEDLQFQLDRSGAELRAESKMYTQPIPMHYIFDHPFLIIMRKRGETRPYFVMWVDNAELLTPMK